MQISAPVKRKHPYLFYSGWVYVELPVTIEIRNDICISITAIWDRCVTYNSACYDELQDNQGEHYLSNIDDLLMIGDIDVKGYLV